MLRSVNSYDNQYVYINKTPADAENGYFAATIASSAIMSAFPFMTKPFERQLYKEQVNNLEYKTALKKAFETTLLKDNVILVDASKTTVADKLVRLGKSAYFAPTAGGAQVVLNSEKASSAGFHELGHALNYFGSKTTKIMQKIRGKCYTVAAFLGSIAFFSRRKPKDAKQNIFDFVQNHAGLLAFLAMSPVIAEESIASYKGIKLAKEVGLSQKMLGNLKKLYSKALLTYAGRAALVGLSVGVAGKIMDKYTRPVKVPVNELNDKYGNLQQNK